MSAQIPHTRAVTVLTTATVALLITALPAQRQFGGDAIHPFLADEIRRSTPKQMLPVYFVMRDQLSHDHWFPRLNRISVDERRAVVVAELRAHAARTQEPLLRELRRHLANGVVKSIRSNWLGNFVCARVTPDVAGDAAALPSVSQVWADTSPPMELVMDGSVPKSAAPASTGGLGPIETLADEVWARGVRGQGVVICNADCGINLQHHDLRNRLWTNPGEIPGNNVDDEGNGFIDDVHGWTFDLFGGNNNLDDGGGHGTWTAGCLVADGSCTGTINGQAPGARVMTARLQWGETAQWDALQYAVLMGAHVQTSSHSYKIYFVPPPNYAMHRIVADNTLAAGLIRTNSTSNDGLACADPVPQARPFNVSAPGCVPPPYLDPNQTLRGRKSGVLGVGVYDVRTGALNSYSPCGPFAWNLADLLMALPSYPLANWSPSHDDFPYMGGSQQGLLKPDITAPDGNEVPERGTCAQTLFLGTSAATPNTAGVLALWKSANMSLKPEDVAMIVHQTARDTGSTPGKEDGWGAGKIDALAGLERALCVHRVDGQPAWDVSARAGDDIVFEIDATPGVRATILVGLSRSPVPYGPVTVGVGQPAFALWSGVIDSDGEVNVRVATLPGSSFTVFTQAFVDDRRGPTGKLLASNVIETRVR